LETFLYIVFFISCIVLVGTVLLQPGKTDAGALFTSGISSASLNPRGTASILSKLTIIAASLFMLTALLLSLPALTGKVSVLQTQGENNPSSATSANSNVNADANSANTNTEANVDANSSTSSNTESNADEKKSDEPKKDEVKQDGKAEEKKDDSKDKTENKK
jgi:preprotein translocase subunit SecG